MIFRRCIKIRQRDQSDCGAACIASILRHYRSNIPLSRIRQTASTDSRGTNALGLIQAFEKTGFRAKGVRCDAESLPHIPHPSIAHISLENGFQHFMVIFRVTRNNVLVMDPADGKIHRFSREYFQQIWSGIIILAAPGENYQPVKGQPSNRKRFLYLLRPHRYLLFQAIAGAVIYTLLGFSTSIYLEKLTDYVIVHQAIPMLHLLSLVMLVLIIFQVIISVIKNRMVLSSGQMIDARLILGYYEHLLRLPQRFFDSMRIGEIVSRINDAGKIRQFINDTLINMIVNILIIVFSAVIMLVFHWKLALLVMLIMPCYAVIYFIINTLNKKQERILMERSADLESHLFESLRNIRTVKKLGMEQEMGTKTEVRFISLLKSVYHSGRNSIFSSTSSEFVTRLFTLILLWAGTLFIFRQELSPGKLMSFYAILGYLSGPAAGLIGLNKVIQNALIAADRLFDILDLDQDETGGAMELEDWMVQDIQIRNVSFAYGTRRQLFNGLSLYLPAGSVTAITGESGSGKSTIASLLNRTYELDDGHILFGNQDIRQFTRQSLNTHIGIVPQDVELFSETLLWNIAPGESEPDMHRILSICRELKLDELINELPTGLHTLLGENGINLSGGQRQRIAIARALYREPRLLILDEATSALDHQTEQQVQHVIQRLRSAGTSVLIISHRNSTLAIADRVYCLQDGRLSQVVTPEIRGGNKKHKHPVTPVSGNGEPSI